jgi:hypothetical protein
MALSPSGQGLAYGIKDEEKQIIQVTPLAQGTGNGNSNLYPRCKYARFRMGIGRPYSYCGISNGLIEI